MWCSWTRSCLYGSGVRAEGICSACSIGEGSEGNRLVSFLSSSIGFTIRSRIVGEGWWRAREAQSEAVRGGRSRVSHRSVGGFEVLGEQSVHLQEALPCEADVVSLNFEITRFPLATEAVREFLENI